MLLYTAIFCIELKWNCINTRYFKALLVGNTGSRTNVLLSSHHMREEGNYFEKLDPGRKKKARNHRIWDLGAINKVKEGLFVQKEMSVWTNPSYFCRVLWIQPGTQLQLTKFYLSQLFINFDASCAVYKQTAESKNETKTALWLTLPAFRVTHNKHFAVLNSCFQKHDCNPSAFSTRL